MEKEKELNLMKIKMNKLEKNELNWQAIQNKENEVNKKIKELNEKEKMLII